MKNLLIYKNLITYKIVEIKSKAPGFDDSAAKEEVEKWTTPLTSFLLWAVPLVTAIVILIAGIAWMTKDEETREQKPFLKTMKQIIIVAVICELVIAILKIFGIA